MNTLGPNPQKSWFCVDLEADSVVVALRLRYHRNITGFSFPSRWSARELEQLQQAVNGVVQETFESDPWVLDLSKLLPVQQALISERFLANSAFLQKRQGKLWSSQEEDRLLLLGDEDHLTLTVYQKGFDWSQAFQKAESWESSLAERLGFSFQLPWGYLTAQLKKSGSGFFPSALLHMPASTRFGLLDAMARTVEREGFTFTSLWPHGQGESDFYWLTPGFSTGRAPSELLHDVQLLTQKLRQGELEARKREKENSLVDWEDRLGRAWGILTNARKLTWEESIIHLSALRLDPESVILNAQGLRLFDRLLFRLQSAQLRSSFPNGDNEEEKNRAFVARKLLLEGEDPCLKD